MLPDPPQVPGYDFACYYNPATTLSGDFFDFIPVSAHELGIVVGDVTGHGLEAAFIMAAAKKAISILGQGKSSPREVLAAANENLHADLDEMTFVSVFYGILDRGTKMLSHVRAGHNPTILLNPARPKPVEELRPRGIVVGMQLGDSFLKCTEEVKTQLQAGDTVVLYTDGIIEAKNAEGTEYGKDRMIRLLQENSGKRMAENFGAVIEDFASFLDGAEQEDDITLVGFRVL